MEYLAFQVSGDEFALSLPRVQEVSTLGHLTRVPGAAPAIRGVLNLRGSVVPVVDVAVRLGRPRTRVSARTCVIHAQTFAAGVPAAVGLLVDALAGVLSIAADDVLPPPAALFARERDLLLGVGNVAGRLVPLLELDLLVDVTRVWAAVPGPELRGGAEAAAADPPPPSEARYPARIEPAADRAAGSDAAPGATITSSAGRNEPRAIRKRPASAPVPAPEPVFRSTGSRESRRGAGESGRAVGHGHLARPTGPGAGSASVTRNAMDAEAGNRQPEAFPAVASSAPQPAPKPVPGGARPPAASGERPAWRGRALGLAALAAAASLVLALVRLEAGHAGGQAGRDAMTPDPVAEPVHASAPPTRPVTRTPPAVPTSIAVPAPTPVAAPARPPVPIAASPPTLIAVPARAPAPIAAPPPAPAAAPAPALAPEPPPRAPAPGASAASPGPQEGRRERALIHAVRRGDTLWALSRRHYGNPFLWHRIHAANQDRIRDPNLISPGERLRIPPPR